MQYERQLLHPVDEEHGMYTTSDGPAQRGMTLSQAFSRISGTRCMKFVWVTLGAIAIMFCPLVPAALCSLQTGGAMGSEGPGGCGTVIWLTLLTIPAGFLCGVIGCIVLCCQMRRN